MMKTRSHYLFVLLMGLPAFVACSSDSNQGPTGDLSIDTSSLSTDGAVADVATQDAGALDSAPLTLLTNENPCGKDEGSIGPSQDEDGYLVATRLTPQQYPFTVTTVRYRLKTSTSGCDSTLAHRVEVHARADITPDNDPVDMQTIEVPADPSAAPDRTVEHKLAQPITLDSGEELFIAVSLPIDSDKKLCVALCLGNGKPDRLFWSNASTTPYAWSALNGLSANPAIEALGSP